MNEQLVAAAKALAQAHVDWHLARMCFERNATFEDKLTVDNAWRDLLNAQDHMNAVAEDLAADTFSHN